MLPIFIAIAPVFLMIILGYLLRRGGIPSTEFWNLNDKLVYWVLMPALFFAKISAADLTSPEIWSLAAILYSGFFAAIACGLLLGRAWAPAEASSILQGSARFNTFIALALAEALFGAAGLQVAVLGSALLIPVVNVTIVSLLSLQLGAGRGGLLGQLIRNPLILSILAGVAVNLMGWQEIPVLHEMARILGSAALPIMLMCVGANLKLRGLQASAVAIGAATFGKLVVFPAGVMLALLVLQPAQLTSEVAIIFAALPTGVAAYTLARQMGGNALLMAAIITSQTLLSFLTLPATLTLLRWVIG
ncbi:AEC family transporter [Tropicimonas sp. TH_r6]|uniref:AEC family transporter n=1 Tax=Tropicimonas sp. TH_r6 TaxID=3082085 RepID=UPI002954C463|nr:AEC family transporter [Tropicimonas sp. TH_r6]MDV7141160.1 AEC family transporter [Tropicimonas sp. TH_r6]